MGRNIYLSESQFRDLFRCLMKEGVTWGNDNGNLSLNINSSNLDKDNLNGDNFVDTRMFGDRSNILYGDGTMNGRSHNLNTTVLQRRAIITTMLNVIDYVKNGRKGALFTDNNLPSITRTSVEKWLKNLSDEEVVNNATQTYNYWVDAGKQKEGVYNRVNVRGGGDKIARYSVFTINGTNVKCIALFNMGDFSLSDAIKKGSFSKTNSLVSGDEYEANKNGEVNVVYDGNARPDIEKNFSLKNVGDGHFKTQYQLQNANYGRNTYSQDELNRELSKEKNYTSVNQFLDKSIMYAAYALKKESFAPDYMVTVPSSSKMNHYYATNLSNKTGVQYLPDFFQRNIVNAHLRDGITDQDLEKDGLTPQMIEQLKIEIRDYAYQEITYEIEQPLRKLVKDNIELFSNISREKNSREKYDVKRVITLLSVYCFRTIEPMIDKDDELCKHLCRNFLQQKVYVDTNMLNSFFNLIKFKIGIKVFDNVLLEMKKRLEYFRNKVQTGYYPGKKQYGLGAAKITRIPKVFRKYIEGSFIIADKYANENSRFFNELSGKNILIIDEDINTGSSFQLAIDAIKSKIPSKNDNTLLCLANGYSEAGNRYR